MILILKNVKNYRNSRGNNVIDMYCPNKNLYLVFSLRLYP